ncbi:MAG: PDZ domain-containing protein [Thermoguttaceae bacterium]|jgi:hypothetical protein
MKRNLSALLLCSVLSLGWGVPRLAVAQPELDRLEQQIRSQGGQAGAAPAAPLPLGQIPAGARPAAARPYLGATVDDRDDRGRGVRVMDVRPGGPADRAGLKVRDLIVGAGGVRVRQLSDLTATVELLSAGDKLPLEIDRNGQPQSVAVTLGQRDAAGAPLPGTTAPAPIPPIPPPPETIVPPGSLPAGPAFGKPAGDAARIEQLERRVEELERRVEQLERALRQSSPRT